MRSILIIIGLMVQGTLLFAQKETRDIHKGNKLYEQGKFKEAELNYRKSVQKASQNLEGNFNLADALYKQKKYAEAGELFNKIGSSTDKREVVAGAYHNLGNSLFEAQKLQESIDAYKKALINNPKDDQTRYNLAYAQQMLKKQEQKKKDQNNKDKKDNKKDPNKKNQDKKDQDKKDQDKKDQDKKDQDKKDQDRKDQQAQPLPNKLSKQDAERMLEALNNEERNTQEKLKNKKLKGVKVKITKDW